jgi:hypothetical protein
MTSRVLDRVRVAAPCKAEWKWMYGNDRVRFCSQCNLNVYNLSAMTREEAELLVLQTEDRLCVRFYRRSDGTVLTRNCPVGLQRIKNRLTNTKNHIITALLGLAAYVGGTFFYQSSRLADFGVIPVLTEKLGRPYPYAIQGLFVPTLKDPTVHRSERQMRERAVLRVLPVDHVHKRNYGHTEIPVRITVDTNGEVETATALKGPKELRDLAEEAALRWTFMPTSEKNNNMPVRVESILTFPFK